MQRQLYAANDLKNHGEHSQPTATVWLCTRKTRMCVHATWALKIFWSYGTCKCTCQGSFHKTCLLGYNLFQTWCFSCTWLLASRQVHVIDAQICPPCVLLTYPINLTVLQHQFQHIPVQQAIHILSACTPAGNWTHKLAQSERDPRSNAFFMHKRHYCLFVTLWQNQETGAQKQCIQTAHTVVLVAKYTPLKVKFESGCCSRFLH